MKTLADALRSEIEKECRYPYAERAVYVVFFGPSGFVGSVAGSYEPDEEFFRLQGSFLTAGPPGDEVAYIRYDAVTAFALGGLPVGPGEDGD